MRTLRIVRAYPDRWLGWDDHFPHDRLSSGFVQASLWQIIGVHRDNPICTPNYAVFDLFPSGAIWNFNLDGLADRWCGSRHQVLSLHGRV
jgi:hypothetical protein